MNDVGHPKKLVLCEYLEGRVGEVTGAGGWRDVQDGGNTCMPLADLH